MESGEKGRSPFAVNVTIASSGPNAVSSVTTSGRKAVSLGLGQPGVVQMAPGNLQPIITAL